MDVRLSCVGMRDQWDIMVRYPGAVRYRRCGTLVNIGWRWLAYEQGDKIERATKREAISEFLNLYVLGNVWHTDPKSLSC